MRRGYWTATGVIPRWQLVTVYVLIVAAAGVGQVRLKAQSDRTQRLSDRTNAALCALRADLQDRVNSSEAFLKDHPHGIPGIPAATIRTNINGQRRTIKALSVLKCRLS